MILLGDPIIRLAIHVAAWLGVLLLAILVPTVFVVALRVCIKQAAELREWVADLFSRTERRDVTL